jgi:hypothetical protein
MGHLGHESIIGFSAWFMQHYKSGRSRTLAATQSRMADSACWCT